MATWGAARSLEPEQRGNDAADEGDGEDDERGDDDFLPVQRPHGFHHGWLLPRKGDCPRLSVTWTVSPGFTATPGGGSWAAMAFSGTDAE